MRPFAQGGVRGKAPAAVAVHLRRADGDVVIVNCDGAAGFAAAAKGRTGIIGGLAAGERAGYAAHIIGNAVEDWGLRGCRIYRGHRCTRSGIACPVSRGDGQGLAVGVRRAQIDGELAVAVGLASADHIPVGIGDGDGAVGFGAAAKLSAICGESEVAGRARWGSVVRIGAWLRGVTAVAAVTIPITAVATAIAIIVVAPATTTAAATCGQGNAACHCHPTQRPRPDRRLTCRRGGCSRQQGINGGYRLVALCRDRIANPPQGAVAFLQHQLADPLIARDKEVFEGDDFAIIQLNDQVVTAAFVAENVGAFGIDFNDGGIIQRHLRSVCYPFHVRQFGDDSDFTHVYYSRQSAMKWRAVSAISIEQIERHP